MAKVYDEYPEGWVTVSASDLRIACCSCGLTHKFRIRKKNNRYQMKIDRDDRTTALLRRHNDHECVPKGEK